MNREKDFLKNTIILGLGKFLPKLTTFITLPILTACLTKAEYGTYDLILTVSVLLIPITTLQINSAGFRFLIEARENLSECRKIISSLFVFTIPITLISSMIVPLFFPDLSYGTRIILGIYLFADTLYLTAGQVCRGLGYNRMYSIASLLLAVTNMTTLIITVFVMRRGIQGVILSLAAAQIVGFGVLCLKIKLTRYISLNQANRELVKDMLVYSWPMVPNNLSAWVLKLSDRFVITAALGIQANAVYAVANKIPNLLAMAQQVVNMSWQENASLAVTDQDSEKYYSKMMLLITDFMFGCTALLIGCTPIMFLILIKGDYQEAYYQMPVLILGMFFCVMSSVLGGIYIAHKKTKSVGITTMIAAVINLVVDLLTVRWIGIWAGSVSTLAAYLFLYFYRMIDIQKIQKIPIDMKRQLLQLFLMTGMLVLCFLKNSVLDSINILIGIGCFVLCNKTYITLFMRKIKRR